jgi:predicted urease superfamily metal-dependent hydrolase
MKIYSHGIAANAYHPVYKNTLTTMMDNRERMKHLCARAGSYPAAAALIQKATQRPLSVDAIKSWTCDAAAKRARTCPDWAIEVLEKKLNQGQ